MAVSVKPLVFLLSNSEDDQVLEYKLKKLAHEHGFIFDNSIGTYQSLNDQLSASVIYTSNSIIQRDNNEGE